MQRGRSLLEQGNFINPGAGWPRAHACNSEEELESGRPRRVDHLRSGV